jgi:transcriptional regulator of arginine metabolism
MTTREERQDAIRALVRSEGVRTQRALTELLNERGCDCTQATVSRDVAEMGLCKDALGAYVLAEDLHLQRMVRDLVTDVRRASNLVVVHAQAGTAPGVAAALDAAGFDDVLGSVAGDDTIILVAATDAAAEAFVAAANHLRGLD